MSAVLLGTGGSWSSGKRQGLGGRHGPIGSGWLSGLAEPDRGCSPVPLELLLRVHDLGYACLVQRIAWSCKGHWNPGAEQSSQTWKSIPHIGMLVARAAAWKVAAG